MTASSITEPSNTQSSNTESSNARTLVERHLTWGWGGLVLFLLFGLALEALHAFKAPLYLNAENETRRFLWRLAHAHGALLSILQLGASWTFAWLDGKARSFRGTLISRCLLASLVLLPGGFFLSGWGAVDGDPGFGIVLVPAGAIFLLVGTVLLFVATRSSSD